MPFPGTRAIPTGWAPHHRPVANGTMNAEGDIHRTSTGPVPYGEEGTAAAPIWSGPMRVQETQRGRPMLTTDQPTEVRHYLITLPIDGLPDLRAGEHGDTITVTASSDPHLAGRLLRIIDIQHGSEMFERDVLCTDNLTENNPT